MAHGAKGASRICERISAGLRAARWQSAAMAVLVDLMWLLMGLAALYFGAEWLVTGASRLAVKYGVSSLVVGLTVVAFGTSAPELFVSIGFNLRGYPDMALGNVIGSNICNIGLILGLSAFICVLRVGRPVLLREMPILIGATFVVMWMLADQRITRWEGAVLAIGILAYTVLHLSTAHRRPDPELVESFESEIQPETARRLPVWKLSGLILAGLVALYFGATWLEKGGVGIAVRFGVPQGVIALTLIAFSTSVPELATSVVAAVKREGDIIVGNVVGSCLFNLLSVLGVTALVRPMWISQIEAADLWVMTGLTVALLPIMWLRKRIGRLEGGLFLALYAAYCVFLYVDRVAG